IDERKRDVERALSALTTLSLFRETAEVRAMLMGQVRALTADGEETADLLGTLERGGRAIAPRPVRALWDPVDRTVRDLCRTTGKEARLSVFGAEISLDRRVLESIRGPLIHLIRNALDHGVESPEQRTARGKCREGAITIRVEQQGTRLFLEISD